MRIKLATEKAVAAELVNELEGQPGIDIEATSTEKDLTEQAFGLAEVGIVIAAVKGVVELATAIWKFAHRDSSDRQTVRLQSAVGSVTIELSPDASVDDLRQLVEPLFAVK
jgi:hypothetical protein